MKIAAILTVLILCALLLTVLYFRHRLINVPDEGNLEASIDLEVGKAMRGGKFPGIVVGVYRNEQMFIKGYGTERKEHSAPPHAGTMFQIGSISKLFTASLLRALCEEGVVSLDSTLAELIGGLKPLSPKVQRVTLRQLVSHTSGFPSIPKSINQAVVDLAGKEGMMLDPYSHLKPELIFDYLSKADDMREAGVFEYSNFGMGLLGHVLELVTRKDYESLVREKVLLPLEMHGTTIAPRSDKMENLAQGYAASGAAAGVWRFKALAGAGAFYSTAEDVLKFVRASLKEIVSGSKAGGPVEASRSLTDPALGWMKPSFLDRLFGNEGILWHNGMVGGYASYVSIDAKNRTGVVLLTNQASATEMLGMMLTRQVRTQSWASKP